MSKVYTFPAIFEYADDGINIWFPDMESRGAYTCAHNHVEALRNAEDILELVLSEIKRDGIPISEPLGVEESTLISNQHIVQISVEVLTI